MGAHGSSGRRYLQARRLCPDGVCVGLVGDDGRCRVCGQSAPAPLNDGVEDSLAIGRRVCDDGACIGVLRARRVGPPYRTHVEVACSICGRPGALSTGRASLS
jgi:hypothetical protein